MQHWFITLCSVVFLLSCANMYIQAKRRAFILTCLGFTGILFCLSFLIAAISLPTNKSFDNLNKTETIICYITGIMLSIQTMALFSIIFALSIELYVTFRISNRAVKDSLLLKSGIVFFCCFQPTLFIIINIILMLIKNIQIVDIMEESGWCNVKVGGNRWGVLFIRALPLWFISIPGALIACAAIIPSLIMAIKTRRKHRGSGNQPEANSRNPTISSRNQISREVSYDLGPRPTSPTSATSPVSENPTSDLSPSTIQSSNKISNEALTRMALYCILYSAIGIPYSVYGLIDFFNYWKKNENETLDRSDTIFSDYLSVGICMATLILIFLIFATNGSSIKQYKEAWIWWKSRCFDRIYAFITRKNDSIHVDILRNVGSSSEKEPREPRESTSISIRTVIPEENLNLSNEANEAQEELPATVSSKNSITSKTKKRWSIFTASRESLTESEKTKKVRRSTENIDENSSPTALFHQKTNRNPHNFSMSSSSTYSSATAIAIDSSEPSSLQNNDPSDKSTVPILGGLSPAPRRTPPLSNPLRDYNDDKDDEITPSANRPSSPQIRNISIIPRQISSAPTSPISTSRPPGFNNMRTNRMSSDRYNNPQRRFTSPLRRPSSPVNNRASGSTSTSYSQTSTKNATLEEEVFDDGSEPFPSLLKIGKSFNDEIGTWRPASPLALASRSIRMSNVGAYNSNVWDRPDAITISRLSSSPTTTGNLFRSGSLPIVNNVNGSRSGSGENRRFS